MLQHGLRGSFARGIALFTAITLLMCAESVFAQGKKGKTPTPPSDPQLEATIQLLRSVHKTLEMANHDYGGHRANALRDITAAVKELKSAQGTAGGKKDPASKGKTPPKGKDKTPAPMEAQALSDAQLAGAIPMLKQAAAQLQNMQQNLGGHRDMAVAKLNAAIQQIETALSFSRAKNPSK